MTIASNWDGKCKGTVNENGEIVIHTWKAGEAIHYQKEPKCVCVNEQCYERQKSASGNPAENKQQTSTVQNRTESEKTDDAKHMLEILWTMADTKSKAICPVIEDENFEYQRQRLIIAQVLFKALSYNWSRP